MIFFLLIIMGYIYFSLKNPTSLNVSTIRNDSTLLPKTEVSKSEAKKEAPKTRDPGSQLNIPQDKFSKKRVRRDENAKIMSGEYHPALPKNYRLAHFVFALKKEDFLSSMGEKIEERNGYIFFYSEQKPQDFTNVVIDSGSDRFFILSSVLKLSNIDNSLRNAVLSKGFEEHFYHDDLNILYVQSNQNDIFKVYEELADLKLKPQIEVIRSMNQLK